jgi:hypothetical protein
MFIKALRLALFGAILSTVLFFGAMAFTSSSAQAAVARYPIHRDTVYGSYLSTERACVHTVHFFLPQRDLFARRLWVYGPDWTHPTIIARYGREVIASYSFRGCSRDNWHAPWQFALVVS